MCKAIGNKTFSTGKRQMFFGYGYWPWAMKQLGWFPVLQVKYSVHLKAHAINTVKYMTKI